MRKLGLALQIPKSKNPTGSTRLIVEALEPRVLLSSGIELVSISSSGILGNDSSKYPSLSSDGRYVAFRSDASNLVPGDTNGFMDVFVYDRAQDITERISIASSGEQGNGDSSRPSISADGRYVAFMSEASDLVDYDTNGQRDIFVYDRQSNLIKRVSVSSNDAQANDWSDAPNISGNGQYVVFRSTASNLVPNDTNEKDDIFIYDREAHITERVSISSSWQQANSWNDPLPSISFDGRYVAFSSAASNLVSSDTNWTRDVFVRDRELNLTERVSISSSGMQGNGSCRGPVISDDGRYVAFASKASNLVYGDNNWRPDIFVYDRELDIIEQLGPATDWGYNNDFREPPDISADGRYVAFASDAYNLVDGDTNWVEDMFVCDRATSNITRLSVSSSDIQGNDKSSFPRISADGSYVAFMSEASNLVPGDVNGKQDIFVVRNPDDYGDSPGQAHPLQISQMIMGNFERSVDSDCFSFQAIAGQEYYLRTSTSVSSSVSPTLILLDTNGSTILLQNNDSNKDKQIGELWTAPRSGTYYIKTSPQNSGSFSTVAYSLSVTDGPADWTFMMYIAGDNNLDPYILPDVLEIMLGYIEGDFNTRVNLVMQIDGYAGSESTLWSSTRRATVSPIVTNQDIGERNMGDPDTLSEYVNWAVTEYPAEHYALVMWGHGGQFLGVCSDDDTNSNGDILDMADFSTAFNNIDVKLDIIGFNACLMAGVEPAYQIGDAADIYVASEPSEYGNLWEGTVWDYAELFEYLFSNPSVNPQTLAGVIVSSYSEFPFEFLDDAISAIDLNNLKPYLVGSIDNFANYMLTQASRDDWLSVEQARENTLQLASGNEYFYRDLCDLGYFMQSIILHTQNENLKSAVQPILVNLANTVLNEWHDNNLAGVTGLTIYLPKTGGEIHPEYNHNLAFLKDTSWDDFVEIFVSGDYPESDNVPPSAPGTPDLHSSSDSGFSSTDNITNDTTPTFSWTASVDNSGGTGVAGYQWRIDDDNWSDWQTTLSATTLNLPDGEYIFYIRAKDNAGNIGTEASLEFVIDTDGPAIIDANPLGVLTENFEYVNITFNEPIDINTFTTFDAKVSSSYGNFMSSEIHQLSETSFQIEFDNNLKGGNYNLVIGPLIVDLAGNTMTQAFEGEFSLPTNVTIGNGAAKKISFYDEDNSLVTVKIVGGNASVLFEGTDIWQVDDKRGVTVLGNNVQIANMRISGNEKTTLIITAKGGNNQADLGGITGDSIGKLIGKGIDLVGNVNLTGSLGMLMIGDIAENVVFEIGGAVIKSFQANSFASGSLVADNIGKVNVKEGALGAYITARTGDILSISAASDITGNITAEGAIKKIMTKKGNFSGVARAGTELSMIQAIDLKGAILSAGQNIGKVKIKGDILDSYILGGYDIGADCAFGLQDIGGGDILSGGNVVSVTAKGRFVRSYISAGVLPNSALTDHLPAVGEYASTGSIGKVKFGSIDYFDATVDFGLFAATEIKPFKIGREKAESRDYFLIEQQT